MRGHSAQQRVSKTRGTSISSQRPGGRGHCQSDGEPGSGEGESFEGFMGRETLKQPNTEHLFQSDSGSPLHNPLTHCTACLHARKNPITGFNRIIAIIRCELHNCHNQGKSWFPVNYIFFYPFYFEAIVYTVKSDFNFLCFFERCRCLQSE